MADKDTTKSKAILATIMVLGATAIGILQEATLLGL